jgi:hypothetical protein
MAELSAAGYARVHDLAPGQDAAFREVEYHHVHTNASGTSVELHWGIIKRQFGLRVRESLWWSQTQRVALGGAEVLTLSNEIMLVYLAIHGGKHEWPHLRWIGDIAAVVRMPMDWGVVREVSASLGTLRMTRLALALAASVLPSMPGEARELASGDAAVPALAEEIWRRLASGVEAPGFVASTRFQLVVRERLGDRLAFAVHHAVTPNIDDLKVAELPGEWRGLYLVLRPMRLVRKWVSEAIGR